MVGPFKQHGLALLGNGYRIVPIPPGRKGPALPKWREVVPDGVHQFDSFVNGTHEVDQRGTVVEMPNVRDRDGVGILTDYTPGVDIDCLDEALSLEMEQFVKDSFGDAPVRIGLAPKRLLVFRTDDPFPKVTSGYFIDPNDSEKVKHRVEVLGEGQQFVAYHVHPDTKKPYEWVDDWCNPLDVPSDELPPITADQARTICKHFDYLAKQRGWQEVGGDKDDTAKPAAQTDSLLLAAPPAETDEEVARVKEALKHISPDCSRDEYLIVLAGLKWSQWLCAEELALEWAEGSKEGKFNERDFARDWKSLTPEKGGRTRTLASVVRMAVNGGFDASRKTTARTEAEIEAAGTVLLARAKGLVEEDLPGLRTLLKDLREAELDVVGMSAVIKAIAKSQKTSRGQIEKAYADTREKAQEKPTHANYAQRLLEHLEDKYVVRPVGVHGSVYTCNPETNVWEPSDVDRYAVVVAKLFDGAEGCTRRNDYVSIARQMQSHITHGNEHFFEPEPVGMAPIGMACGEKFYFIDEDGTIKRDQLGPEHRQIAQFPFAPKVMPTPLFDGFLADALKGDSDAGQRGLLQEIIGAAMLGFFYRHEKVVLLKGPGRSGKGTMLKIIEAIFPKELVSSVPPVKWTNEYYLADIAAKRLNIVGEIEEEGAIDGAILKSVSGRDLLTARRPAQMPFKFRSGATHIFNGNYFPPTRDQSDAFFSRWVLVEFRNSRIGKPGAIDTNLAGKIIDRELPGVMAWALQGAKRLLERNELKLTPEHELLMSQWRGRSNSVVEFLQDRDDVRLGDGSNFKTKRSEFYLAYSMWCRESGRKAMSKGKVLELIETPAFKSLGIAVSRIKGDFYVTGMMLRTNAFFGVEDEEL